MKKRKRFSKKNRARNSRQESEDSSSSEDYPSDQSSISKANSKKRIKRAADPAARKPPRKLKTSTPAKSSQMNSTSDSETSVDTSVSRAKENIIGNSLTKSNFSLQTSKTRKKFRKAIPSDADNGEIAIFMRDLMDLETLIRTEVAGKADEEGEYNILRSIKSKHLIPRRRAETEAVTLHKTALRSMERCKAKLDEAKADAATVSAATASLKTAEAFFDKDIAGVLTRLRQTWWKEGRDEREEELTAAQESFNTLKEELNAYRERLNAGKDLQCRTIDLSSYMGSPFEGEKELYPTWRAGWRKAEAKLQEQYNASEEDLFHQLIRNLAPDTDARKMAKAKGGIKGQYQAALQALDEAFGDPISLAIEAMAARNVALADAPDKLKRLTEMNHRLKEDGTPLEALLTQQLLVRMVRTPTFDANAAWQAYLKQKKLRATDDPNSVSSDQPSEENRNRKLLRLLLSNFQKFDLGDAYSVKGLSAFCNTLAADEEARNAAKPASGSAFLAKGEKKGQRQRKPDQQGKHYFNDNGALIGCVKHGHKSTHTSLDCKALGFVPANEWEELCGPVCRKCASHRGPHPCHQRCTSQGCGKPHLPSRHHLHAGEKRAAAGTTAAPPPKKGKFSKPKGKDSKNKPNKKEKGQKKEPKKDKAN